MNRKLGDWWGGWGEKENIFFFQAEDGIRDLVRSRGLGDVYKRQKLICVCNPNNPTGTIVDYKELEEFLKKVPENIITCLLYTSDAADDMQCVDLRGPRIT
ncbi:putative aminotransferase [Clostridioides difficile]|nr:putative aminotransferase [Clostridioides difficile]